MSDKRTPDDFIDRFAIIGPPEVCVERLRALADLGVERFVISGPSPLTTPELAREADLLFSSEVIPAFR